MKSFTSFLSESLDRMSVSNPEWHAELDKFFAKELMGQQATVVIGEFNEKTRTTDYGHADAKVVRVQVNWGTSSGGYGRNYHDKGIDIWVFFSITKIHDDAASFKLKRVGGEMSERVAGVKLYRNKPSTASDWSWNDKDFVMKNLNRKKAESFMSDQTDGWALGSIDDQKAVFTAAVKQANDLVATLRSMEASSNPQLLAVVEKTLSGTVAKIVSAIKVFDRGLKKYK
jgi:hypothetical protein